MTNKPTRVALSLILLIGSSAQAADDCEPKFGDQILNWVKQNAEKQSHGLARNDFQVRTFNQFLLGYEDINDRLIRATDELGKIEAALRAHENALSKDQVTAALQRDRSANTDWNGIYNINAQIEDVARRHTSLFVEPEKLFVDLGLFNVGRATLLASMQQLGDSTKDSLTDRYSVYVKITFNESGEFEGASFERSPDMADSVVMAGALQWGGPYAYAIIIAYHIVRTLVASEECRRKVEDQKTKVRQAYHELPTKLITREALLALYTKFYNEQVNQFESHTKNVTATIESLRTRWREIAALNAARAQTANSILTPARITAVRREYDQFGDKRGVFDNVAMIKIASDVTALNRYLLAHQAHLFSSCNNVDGLLAFEDQTDAWQYASAAYNALAKNAVLAPIDKLFVASSNHVKHGISELPTIKASIYNKNCALPQLAKNTGVTFQKNEEFIAVLSSIRSKKAQSKLTSKNNLSMLNNPVQAVGGPKVASVRQLFPVTQLQTRMQLANLNSPSMSMCVLVGDKNQGYRCGGAHGSGPKYSGQFDLNDGNIPRSVGGRVNDGGYSQDNRRIETEIEGINKNINDRVLELELRYRAVAQAFPQWIQNNSSSASSLNLSNLNAAGIVSQERQQFVHRNQEHIAQAQASIDEFLRNPGTRESLSAITNTVGAGPLTLPELPPDSIPPDAPNIAGITAKEIAYAGTSNAVEMAIRRETHKVNRHFPIGTDNGALPKLALALAAGFNNSPGGQIIATSLLKDSASLRYADKGDTATAELTCVSNASILSRCIVPLGATLPPETVLARAEKFHSLTETFLQRVMILQASPSVSGSVEQMRVIAVARSFSEKGQQIFFNGEIVDGTTLLSVAHTLLDLATSFTPGVSWGRDIYESVSGVSLISGEPLDKFGRAAAILGAVSGGIGSKGIKGIKVLSRVASFGESATEAEKIVDATRKIDGFAVKWTEHAIEQAEFRGIGSDLVEDALDRGTKFWDTIEKTVVSFEIEAKGNRVAAVVDIETMNLKTVYHEVRTDAELLKVVHGDSTRFRPIPLD